jgi:hypothetical protein
MSKSKFQKFLDKPRPSITGYQYRVPIILSDSEDLYLKIHVVRTKLDIYVVLVYHRVERQIYFWCKSCAKTEKRVVWQKENQIHWGYFDLRLAWHM